LNKEQWLKDFKPLWVPPLIGFISILIFGGTFGFLAHLEGIDKVGFSWLTVVLLLLAISGVVFVIWSWRSMEHDSDFRDPSLALTTFAAFILAPVASMFMCGVGLWPGVFILYLLFGDWMEVFLKDLKNSDGLGPEIALIMAAIIMGTYIIVGVVAQLFAMLIRYVRKLLKRRKE